MKFTDLEMAHSIELEILHDGKKTTLLTSVEGIIKQSVLLTPIHLDGKIVGFPEKYTVNLLYPADDHVYCWSNVTIKAVRYQNHVYHCVELPGEAQILNRRGAYRVYIGENMNLLKFTRNGSELHEVLIRDISETGFCFISKEEFSLGRTLRLYLRFKNGREISLSAQALWQRENPNRTTTYLYGCKFLERNKLLTSFLMGVQQEKQRKRLGLQNKR